MRTALVGGRTQHEINPAWNEPSSQWTQREMNAACHEPSLPWTQLAVIPSRPNSQLTWIWICTESYVALGYIHGKPIYPRLLSKRQYGDDSSRCRPGTWSIPGWFWLITSWNRCWIHTFCKFDKLAPISKTSYRFLHIILLFLNILYENRATLSNCKKQRTIYKMWISKEYAVFDKVALFS